MGFRIAFARAALFRTNDMNVLYIVQIWYSHQQRFSDYTCFDGLDRARSIKYFKQFRKENPRIICRLLERRFQEREIKVK